MEPYSEAVQLIGLALVLEKVLKKPERLVVVLERLLLDVDVVLERLPRDRLSGNNLCRGQIWPFLIVVMTVLVASRVDYMMSVEDE